VLTATFACNFSGLSTIGNEGVEREMERARSKKAVVARSMEGRWGSGLLRAKGEIL